jgi:hypothetical protein
MSGREDVIATLEAATAAARAAGHNVTGWTLQSSEDGYVAWLYEEDDEGQRSITESVEILPSAIAAARWCLTQFAGE